MSGFPTPQAVRVGWGYGVILSAWFTELWEYADYLDEIDKYSSTWKQQASNIDVGLVIFQAEDTVGDDGKHGVRIRLVVPKGKPQEAAATVTTW